MPCARSSIRSESVSASAACLEAQQVALNGAVNQLTTESTLTRVPPPLRARTGAKARAIPSGPKTFTSISRRSASSAPGARATLPSTSTAFL